ncbi:transglycosylase SLT domain-containing protein [Photobacterium makurazakiensis]|uniref:transglycosylase SLT domain-containing protein n=1 Tax=Photobacterium makurazakiensis TaxID=2910234 RepID=UPI003D0F9E88
MIIHYLFLLSVLAIMTGCQSLTALDENEQPEVTQIDIAPSTFKQHCDVHQTLYDGSYVATGFPNTESTPLSTTTTSDTTGEIELWDTLSDQFTMAVPNNRRIRYYKRWFTNNPYHIKVVTQRAEPFLYYIYQQVDERDLPIELVLLPFIESSFDQFAYSPKGAAGLWQITAPTGRSFGLDIVSGYDGRRDIIASTDAALDLLEYLYDKFDHNWLHAIAAYNTGGGRVRNAIKRNRSAGKSTDFWSLKLPKETRMYVPKLLAMVELVKEREQNELPFASIKSAPIMDEVIISQRVKLKHIAGHAGLSSKAFFKLNPGYTGGYTFKQRDNRILIPKKNKTLFYENKNSYRYVKEKFDVYDIQAGDSLSELAQNNNTSVSLIKQVNNLSDSIIFAGQKLLIPTQ